MDAHQQQNHKSFNSEQKVPVLLNEKIQQINKQKSELIQVVQKQKEIKHQKIEVQQQEKVFLRICQYLNGKNIQFKVIEHEATRTSEQSAAIRKTPLEWGSKTMLVNCIDNQVMLLIYRAHRKVSWKKIRKVEQIGKKAQMATQQQVLKLGVKPGGVPPFPHMIGLKGVLDQRFKQVQMMAFNAGHKCKSIIMKTSDFPLEDILLKDITED